MSDFLSNIVAKNNNQLEMVQPRIPSLFEPAAESKNLNKNLNISGDLEQDVGINSISIANQELPHRSNQVVEIPQLEIESPSTLNQETNHMLREPQRQNNQEETKYLFNRDISESSHIRNPEFPPQSPIISSVNPSVNPSVNSTVNPTVEQQTNFVTNNYLQTVELHNQTSNEPTVIQQLIAKETFTKEIFLPQENTAVIPEIHSVNPQEPITKLEQIILPTVEREASNNIEKSPIPQQILPTQTLIMPQVSVVKELHLAPENKETAPTINVTIGRIEIRATTPTTVSSSAKPKEKPAVMGLEEYLHQRGGGK